LFEIFFKKGEYKIEIPALWTKQKGMDRFDHKIFEGLISETSFIRWAKGKEVGHASEWENWKSVHPENEKEFDEAVGVVQNFTFSSPEITRQEIQYLWEKASAGFAAKKHISKSRNLTHFLTKIAAILFIPLLAYTGWIYFDKNHLETEFSRFAESGMYREITVVAPTGSRTVVDLPDGSKVWLNSQSKLTYPGIFNNRERKVFIDGEAYFEVQNGKVPFVVQNDGPAVKVYGTAFSINSYDDENVVTVALVKGKISLFIDGKERFLLPGQVSCFDKIQEISTIKDEDIEQFVCWREGKLIFRDTPLNSILRILQRQYNVNVELDDPELGNYKYNATFYDESLGQILELLQLSAPIKYTYEKRNLNDDDNSKGKVIILKDKDRNVKH
jgi:ferric-dicitrate binding protein FerR (iron transport regulator)